MKIRITTGAAVLTSPQVPRYNPDSVTAPADLSTPTVPALGSGAFGAGLGEGIQRAVGAVAGIVKDAREKADRTAALNSRTQIDQVETDLLYNPKTGALTTRGSNAFNVDASTLQAYDTKVQEIQGNLATPAQKDTFALMAAQRRAEITKQLQRHIAGELQTYADESNKASLDSTLSNISANVNDPARVEQERKFGLAVIMSDTDNKGLPPAVIKARVDTWESSVHKAVIERKMIDNPVAAQEYFQANRDKLLGADQVKIEHALKPLVKEVEVNAAADDIFRANPSMSRAELVSTLREKYKGKPWLQEAEAEVRNLYADREAAAKAAKDNAESAVYSYISKVKLAGGVPKRSDVPGDVWANLAKVDPEKAAKIADEIRSAQEHATDRNRQEQDRRETKATVQSLTTWGMLKTSPDLLRVTNLDKLLGSGQITKTHYQDLIKDQQDLRTGKGDKETKLLSDKAAVDVVLQAVNITQKKNPERYGKFYDALNGRMKLFEAENNRPPKQEEVKGMARGLLGEVSQDVNFWPIDKSVRVFEADPGKVRVPAAERTKIKAKLEARGLPVTDQTIANIYLEAQRRGGK